MSRVIWSASSSVLPNLASMASTARRPWPRSCDELTLRVSTLNGSTVRWCWKLIDRRRRRGAGAPRGRRGARRARPTRSCAVVLGPLLVSSLSLSGQLLEAGLDLGMRVQHIVQGVSLGGLLEAREVSSELRTCVREGPGVAVLSSSSPPSAVSSVSCWTLRRSRSGGASAPSAPQVSVRRHRRWEAGADVFDDCRAGALLEAGDESRGSLRKCSMNSSVRDRSPAVASA
jgi:hypothetical protein